jgi:hypothetical protein
VGHWNSFKFNSRRRQEKNGFTPKTNDNYFSRYDNRASCSGNRHDLSAFEQLAKLSVSI